MQYSFFLGKMELLPLSSDKDLKDLERLLVEGLPDSLIILSSLHMATKMGMKDHRFFLWTSQDGEKLVATVKYCFGFGRHTDLERFSIFAKGVAHNEVSFANVVSCCMMPCSWAQTKSDFKLKDGFLFQTEEVVSFFL